MANTTAALILGQKKVVGVSSVNAFGIVIPGTAPSFTVALSDDSLATLDAANILDPVGVGSETVTVTVTKPDGSTVAPEVVIDITTGEAVDYTVTLTDPAPAA